MSDFEAPFRAIADAASDGIITIDSSSTITFVNSSVERIFGYSSAELLGKSLTMLMPDYLQRVHLTGMKRYLETGERHMHWGGTQLPGLCKDGTTITLEVSFGEFVQNSQRGFTGIVRDVTERKRDERLQAAHFAASEILAKNLSSEDVLQEALKALCQALGWIAAIVWNVDRVANVLRYGSGWCAVDGLRPFLNSNQKVQVRPSVGLPGHVWSAKEPRWVFELENESDLAERWEHASHLASAVAFPVATGGEVIAIMEFFSTLPESPDRELLETFQTVGNQVGQYIERRNAEQALKRSQEELQRLVVSEQDARRQAEEANHAKDEFLALLSHELRTPLTSVHGWVQLLLEDGQGDPDVLSKALEVIDRNVRLQVRLIDDLLNLSQIITGKLRINRELIDPVQVVENAVESVRGSADAKEISLLLQVGNSGLISADADRLQQAIWNILTNAVKFTPPLGSVYVNVDIVGDDVRILVRDTGMGISEEFLPHVFQLFTQANCSNTRQHGGLGLGLALVRELVEMHGGNVSAHSDGPGQGSTFTIGIPIAQPMARTQERRS